MKKILLSFVAMLFSAASVNADDFVTVASGTQTTQFAVNDIEKIKFGEDIITFVEKSGKETPFELPPDWMPFLFPTRFLLMPRGQRCIACPDIE